MSINTDRELLEMAAKANGFVDDQLSDSDSLGLHRNGQDIYYVIHKHGWHNWHPLTDDGDALRLAVKLCMKVECSRGWQHVSVYGHAFTIDEHIGTDPYAATRRAIVRAAAAIGKEMP